MLFDKLWAEVKGAERAGKLTVEEALDCATRPLQALFCPFLERLFAREDDRAMLVEPADQLEEEIGATWIHWQIAKLVENQEAQAAERR